ncbi:MAG: hypothetical protein E6K54_02445 [Gammaproteobacteria bacterium]|nr:MAG: hypothetical protein E6K54_02445 [Gammaproteobacteria bacterium]
MQNKLLVDIGNGLTKKPFEKIFWWGPRWLDFICITPPLTVNNPLWLRDKKNLKKVRLFGLSPDELQAEILGYWLQPFWKRWCLGLFTPIQRKIRLWSYYHQCLSFREVCIENLFDAKKPIDVLFEQYLGNEMLCRLNKNRIQFEYYVEKHAGNLRLEDNITFLQSMLLRRNSRFFSKLLQKKSTELFTGADKKSLQSQLKKEYLRLRMVLFCYLYNWHKNIFPTTQNEPIYIDTFFEVCAGKEISYSIHSIHDWVKLKQQLIESLLEEQSPEQFFMIKNLLEACLSKIRILVSNHLNNCARKLVAVRKKKLSCKQAIQETNNRQAELIHFFKKCALLFHPDKSFANPELSKIQTELFLAFQQLSKESQKSMKKKLQLLKDYLSRKRKSVQTKESASNQQLAALESIGKINFEPTPQERVEPKISVDNCIQSQVRSNLMHKPLNNDAQQEENESPQRLRRCIRLARYVPVF